MAHSAKQSCMGRHCRSILPQPMGVWSRRFCSCSQLLAGGGSRCAVGRGRRAAAHTHIINSNSDVDEENTVTTTTETTTVWRLKGKGYEFCNCQPGQPMSSKSANTERSWANPTAPTLPYSPPTRRSTLTAVQRWHCAAESVASPGAVTTTSVGRARSTLLVTGTTWTVRGRCASTPFAVTITAGRSNPGSLPAGIPKSTRTMSPASIVGSGCDTKVEPCAITAGQLGGAELTAHAPLSLGSQETRDFFVQGHAVEVSELPKCVAVTG